MELNEIIAGEGLGELKFGLSRDQVIEALGQPDETDTFSEEDGNGESLESWEYLDLELSVSFTEEDDWKMCILSSTSEDVTFKGKKFIGLSESDLASTLTEMGITDLENEDYSSDETPDHVLVNSESLELNFWLNGNVVTEIQWGPLFVDDDTIKWPKI